LLQCLPDEKEEMREREKELSRHNSLLRVPQPRDTTVTPRDTSVYYKDTSVQPGNLRDTCSDTKQYSDYSSWDSKEKGLHETDF